MNRESHGFKPWEDVKIAVQAHPSATQEQLDAVHDAIAIWSTCWRAASTG